MSKVKYITLLKFKEGTSEDQISQAFDQLIDMSETIPGIEDYVGGANSSAQGSSQGYTHGYVITFTDAAARDAYLTNAEQEKVKNSLAPLLESNLVFDFEI